MIGSLKNIAWEGIETYFKKDQTRTVFLLFSVLILSSVMLSLVLDDLRLLVLPGLGVIGYLAIADLRLLYLILWACIPLSTEIQLPGGFGTDFPSEPLAIMILGVGLIWWFRNFHQGKLTHLFHPITIFLLLHFGWILITSIDSENTFISFKYLVAKSWYIGAYFFIAIAFINNEKILRKLLLFVSLPLVFSVLWVLFRHSGQDFSFASINSVLSPFYRNHVSYACTIAVFLPFIWYQYTVAKSHLKKNLWLTAVGILLIGTYLSYTRAAYVCIPLMISFYFIVRWKLTKWVIGVSLISALGFINYMGNQNQYLQYAPNYDRTIAHYQFDELISATYKMEDISTMERFYRWIAGAYMLREEPATGFGPGNFYEHYHAYADRNFITYVSDNPEKSGTHNYYLMVAVEQGIPGILFFILLMIAILLKGEKLFHRSRLKNEKYFILACLLSLVSILFILILNDMLETDKVGALFFFIAAMFVSIELKWLRFQPDEQEKMILSDSSGD